MAFVWVFCSSTGSLKSHCMILLKPTPREIPTRIVSTWSPGRVGSHLSKIQSAVFENHCTLFSKLKESFVEGSRLNLGRLIVVLWLWLYKAFSILCWLLGSSFLFQWSAALDLVCHHLNLLKSRTSWGWVNIPSFTTGFSTIQPVVGNGISEATIFHMQKMVGIYERKITQTP